MLRNLERISRENYEIFVWWKMPKTLDITRILREQKKQLRAGFQAAWGSSQIVPNNHEFHRIFLKKAHFHGHFLENCKKNARKKVAIWKTSLLHNLRFIRPTAICWFNNYTTNANSCQQCKSALQYHRQWIYKKFKEGLNYDIRRKNKWIRSCLKNKNCTNYKKIV